MAKLSGKKRGRKLIKPTHPIGVEGVTVAEKMNSENMFESFNKLGTEFFSIDGAKKIAALYIDTSEKIAEQMIELQERATSWAKETPFAPIFEAQSSMARKLIERSAAAARNLWQIEAVE
jgi:hypothetical protein